MSNIKLLAFSFLVSTTAFALHTKPWFGNLYEFEILGDYTYSHYSRVQNARHQLKEPSNDQDLLFDFLFTPFTVFDVEGEVEFAHTPRQNWGLRSTALQVRYQWLDDIAGDPVSFATGLSVRGVSRHSLKDVSCPYASDVNGELTFSVGKEWSEKGFWTMRMYGFAAVGIANHGSPWMRELFVWQNNWEDTHRLTAFVNGDFGFGHKEHVDVRHFDGWGKFSHQSIDVGAGYGYDFKEYGMFSFYYSFRVFAHNFPEYINFFTLNYSVPFSAI